VLVLQVAFEDVKTASSGEVGREVVVENSALLVERLEASASACFQTADRRACNELGNFCVLQMHDTDASACVLYQELVDLRQVRGRPGPYCGLTVFFQTLHSAIILCVEHSNPKMPWLAVYGDLHCCFLSMSSVLVIAVACAATDDIGLSVTLHCLTSFAFYSGLRSSSLLSVRLQFMLRWLAVVERRGCRCFSRPTYVFGGAFLRPLLHG
jgi:hypothetical protein